SSDLKRNIFAYFQTMEQAKKAEEALKKQGFSEVACDRVSPFLGGNPYDGDEEIHGILHRDSHSLTTNTLGSPNTLDDDERILAAAHPDASGFASSTGFTHAEDVCLTVLTDDEGYQQAASLLSQMGARL